MFAVEGGAGCGKTHELMAALSRVLERAPLAPGQRVLALTFMQGAKHRLHERLRGLQGLAGRAECATIDSFAWRLVRRWRGLLTMLGVGAIHEEDYDAQCAAAGVLLERPEVASWVAASFPIVLVDEAQDLKPERLRMVAALSDTVEMLVAADEFQCLDANLRPNPFVRWLRGATEPLVLDRVRRTRVPGLLDAAAALRAGRAPRSQGTFKIIASRGDNQAPSFVSNAIGWGRPPGGTVALITPSRAGPFAAHVVRRVAERASGRGCGPYPVRWERSDDEDAERFLATFVLAGTVSMTDAIAAIDAADTSGPMRAARQWVLLQSRARGQAAFTRDEIAAVVRREVKMRRRRHAGAEHRMAAMTVHQAKNREFDGVVVLWPYQLGGDDEHRRRLLYNAVTRARNWCTVVVQNEDLLATAPFA